MDNKELDLLEIDNYQNNMSILSHIGVVVFLIFFYIYVLHGFSLGMEDRKLEIYGVGNWFSYIYGGIGYCVVYFLSGYIIGSLNTKKSNLYILGMFVLLGLEMLLLYKDFFSNLLYAVFVGLILICLLFICILAGKKLGYGDREFYKKEKSVLDIKWFHWIWFLPTIALFINVITFIIMRYIGNISDYFKGWDGFQNGWGPYMNEGGNGIGNIAFFGVFILIYMFIKVFSGLQKDYNHISYQDIIARVLFFLLLLIINILIINYYYEPIFL